MRHYSAVQGVMEEASRLMVRRQLGTRLTRAMQEDKTVEVVDELMETPKSDRYVFRAPADGEGGFGAVKGQRPVSRRYSSSG
jgi:CsoR family transcriptional regulator, copper-sensing transcriptional repressor